MNTIFTNLLHTVLHWVGSKTGHRKEYGRMLEVVRVFETMHISNSATVLQPMWAVDTEGTLELVYGPYIPPVEADGARTS